MKLDHFQGLMNGQGLAPTSGKRKALHNRDAKTSGVIPKVLRTLPPPLRICDKISVQLTAPSVTCKRCYGVDLPQVRGPNAMRTKPAPMYRFGIFELDLRSG